MSIKSILVGLVLVGSSTAAFARPAVYAEGGVSVSVRDHRDIDSRWERERREEARERARLERQREARIEWNRRHRYVVQTPVVVEPVYQPPVYPTMIQGPTMLYNGSQELVITQINGSRIGRLSGFSTVKLDGVGTGSTYVDSITIYYPTSTEVVPVKRWINAGGCFDLPIANGAGIVQLAINGQSVNGGSFTVDAV